MAHEKLIETMIDIAREAAMRAEEIQLSGEMGITDKGGVFGTHFLTGADKAAEDIILTRLSAAFPGESIISEEKENDPNIPPDAFLVDPIDGTPCFIHGCQEWGVLLSKLQDGVPMAAVVYIPGRDLLAHAVRGEGCYVNGERMILDDWAQELRDKAMLGIELGPWWTSDGLPEAVLIPLLKRFSIRSMLSAAYGTTAMLLGETQAWINLNVGWPWDFAPGSLFMKEVGGWASGPDGRELEFKRLEHMDVVYAVNEEMAQQILPLTTSWLKTRVG